MILAGAFAIVVVLLGIGTFRIVGPLREFEARSARIEAAPLLTELPQRLQTASERFERNAQQANALADRARVALTQIQRGFAELRLPEAVQAVRVAALAIRALSALR